MVLNIDDKIQFFCYNGGVDMRKGIHSLYSIIKCYSSHSALSGDAFVFIGTNHKSVKIIRWHKEGFLLYHKKLELGRYITPRPNSDAHFFELKSDDIDRLIGNIKHKSHAEELKRAIILNL